MHLRNSTLFALALGLCIGCDKTGGFAPPTPAPNAGTLTVSSTSFPANGPIPVAFSCDGRDAMPALAWSSPPRGTGAQALVVDDPDAPGGTFTHLIAWNMSADSRSIGEGSSPASDGGQLGKNDFGKPGWSGPCPPKGTLHHYRFRVVALDRPLALGAGVARAAFDAALSGHVVAEGVLTGTFQR